MEKVFVTMHGAERLEERMDIRSEDAVAYAYRVWTNGKTINDYQGKQRKMSEGIRTRYCDEGFDVRTFAKGCYIFDSNKELVTCYDLPEAFYKVGRPKPPRFFGRDDEDVSALVRIIYNRKSRPIPKGNRTAFYVIIAITCANDLCLNSKTE